MENGPDFEQVYEHAKKTAEYFVRKYGDRLSTELKEDCTQNALLRSWQAFRKLDTTKHWKAFVQKHCRGAVLDYLKSAAAFEDGLRVKGEKPDTQQVRIDLVEPGQAAQNLDALLARCSANEIVQSSAFAPNWSLVQRMAGEDTNLHIVAKVILGFTQEAIAQQFAMVLGVHMTRERISQRIYEFFDRLDSAEFYYDSWINQCIYALGLSERYHQAEIDNGEGWDLKEFDLYDPRSFLNVQRFYRPTLFDFEELTRETAPANHLAI